MSTPASGRAYYSLTAAELKRAAHEFVEARRSALGENTNPVGFVNLEVNFDEETDRVMGGRLYYTREADSRDAPDQAVQVRGQGRGKRNVK